MATMRCNSDYDVTIIDAGVHAIVVAHDTAARSVLRAKLGVYWCPMPWSAVHELAQPLAALGFSIGYQSERRAVSR